MTLDKTYKLELKNLQLWFLDNYALGNHWTIHFRSESGRADLDMAKHSPFFAKY